MVAAASAYTILIADMEVKLNFRYEYKPEIVFNADEKVLFLKNNARRNLLHPSETYAPGFKPITEGL